ncbi:hypothetical protein TH63_12575 [Rufibacter radiotolerans]|uniref:Outer membrane protein beta-barrel domain-containing protein n=2 Tax=Rufibacter radiotolerans TaxID=1379910 RepID=A0A0H4W759_9BACT|nr:hypothetical protein TH63_12575 [Rufibacter radiotolerans]
MGQGKLSGENLPGYEYKKLRWGFSLGVNSSWYTLEHSQYYIDKIKQEPNFTVNEKFGIGFNVNFITTYRLSPDVVLRAQPGVGYHSRAVEYMGSFEGSENGMKLQEVNTFSGELPLLVKYESKRRKNTQMYFIGGIKPTYVVGGPKKGNPEVLQIKPFDFSIEYGVGLDMFYPFFKFSPELRYSRGISNIHEPYESLYNNSIQKLGTNTITLYLNFE